MEYKYRILSIDSYLLYYFKVSNKVVSTKIIIVRRAYHPVNRRGRANPRVKSKPSEVNEARVSALNIRLIDHYKEFKTGVRSKPKEEI